MSFCVPHHVLCWARSCPCFWFWSFFTLNPFTPILYFCRQSHLPSSDAFFFSKFYEFFLEIFEVFWDFTRFQIFFIFISKLKMIIIILLLTIKIIVVGNASRDGVLIKILVWRHLKPNPQSKDPCPAGVLERRTLVVSCQSCH